MYCQYLKSIKQASKQPTEYASTCKIHFSYAVLNHKSGFHGAIRGCATQQGVLLASLTVKKGINYKVT